MIARLGNPKLLGTLLALSLAGTLFLGGMFAGRMTGQATQAKRSLDAIVAVLPAGKRDAVLVELRAAAPVAREHARVINALRAEVALELAQPKLDEAALDQRFTEIRQRTGAVQATWQQAYKRAAVSLTPDERRALLAALRRPQKQAPES